MLGKIKVVLALASVGLLAAYVVLNQESQPGQERQSSRLDSVLQDLQTYAREEMPHLAEETRRLLERVQETMLSSGKETPSVSQPPEPTAAQQERQKEVADEKYLRQGLEIINERLKTMDSQQLAERMRTHFQKLYGEEGKALAQE